MSEGRERSAEEREAARRERERRRAERGPQAAPTIGPEAQLDEPEAELDEPEDHPEAELDAPEDHPEAELDAPEDHPEAQLDEPEDHPEPEPASQPVADSDGDGTEAPLGTKRVARLQRLKEADAPKVPTRPRRQPIRRSRAPSRVGRIASLLALVLAGVLLWFLYELFQPFHGSGHGSITVTIPAHSSSSQVGDLLERDGVISSSFFFELRATLAGERSHLRPGTYHLKFGMTYGDVLKRLTTPPPPVPTTMLTLIDGKSRQQIDALLRSQGVHGSYVAATRHSRLLNPVHYGAPRKTPDLEGFLFPSTYQLRKPVSIPVLVADQLKTFQQQFAHVDLRAARRRHMSPYDVLIIASIIEDEAATRHDYPLVASVIYNRLKDHMPLGMDSTTRYEFNDWAHPLTSSQLAAHSPYNTRRNVGLPPTPIGNAGTAAINAAAHPARTNYLYFVAGVCGNGSSVFSSNYQQFLRDSARYQRARARRGGSPLHC